MELKEREKKKTTSDHQNHWYFAEAWLEENEQGDPIIQQILQPLLEEKAGDRYRIRPHQTGIHLRSDSFRIDGPPSLLQDIKDEESVYVQWSNTLTEQDKSALEAQGYQFLDYLGDQTWVIQKGQAALSSALFNKVAKVGKILPRDKFSLALLKGQVRSRAVTDSEFSQFNDIDLSIVAYRQSDLGQLKIQLSFLGGQEISQGIALDELRVSLPIQQLAAVGQLKTVQYIQPAIQEFTHSGVDANRVIKQPEVGPESVFGLTGEGVGVGVWDGGPAFVVHPDFDTSKVKLNDEFPPDREPGWHATVVAGAIAGQGVINPKAIGVAPDVSLWSYSLPSRADELIEETEEKGISLSNHSYSAMVHGNGASYYNSLARAHDQANIETGDQHLSIVAAGNHQARTLTHYKGYFTASGGSQAKNGLSIGAVTPRGGDYHVTYYSGFGPGANGAIKPDLVAPTNVLAPDSAGGYSRAGGTSLATPVATGAIALVRQFLNQQSLPTDATFIKALLIHNARDLGDPGPDYQTGWGLVDLQQTMQFIEASNNQPKVKHQTFAEVDDILAFEFFTGGEPMKLTLTWPDPPPAPNLEHVRIHHLDLRVASPSGEVFLPWRRYSQAPSAPTTRGENQADTVLQVALNEAPAGVWRVFVSAKDIAVEQPYHLLSSHALEGIHVDEIPQTPNDDQQIEGDSDHNQLTGGVGNDVLVGHAGDDVINGGEGNDRLIGGLGNDVLDGGLGHDEYIFQPGDGQDTIALAHQFQFFDNQLTLGPGIHLDDISIETDFHDLVIQFQSRDDQIRIKNWANNAYSGKYPIYRFSIDSNVLSPKEFLTPFAPIQVIGSPDDDKLYPFTASGDHLLEGREGDDHIIGSTGTDFLFGQSGDDRIYSSGYRTQVISGVGDDKVTITGRNCAVYTGEGNDFVQMANGFGVQQVIPGEGDDVLSSVRPYEYEYQTGDGADIHWFRRWWPWSKITRATIRLKHILLKNISISAGFSSQYVPYERRKFPFVKLDLPNEDEIVLLNRYKKTPSLPLFEVPMDLLTQFIFHIDDGRMILGEDLQSQIELSKQQTILKGTDSADIIQGTETEDILQGLNGRDDLIAGSGDDLVYAGAGFDNVVGESGNDHIYGGSGADFLSGDSGNDALFGGEGNDRIWGGSGHDRLLGEAGSDTLTDYNGGDDHLAGGPGHDHLNGGDGNDTYFVDIFSETERIHDSGGMNSDQDVLQFGTGLKRHHLIAEKLQDGSAVIRIKGLDVKVYIQHAFESRYKIEWVSFADGEKVLFEALFSH
ncbi:S8 family serine peptidase [Algicola sagamiensis]|uniref:S8 family serine peptidase n=1 Tax=Algicola sagamiensis TaxID=163869 RepID=UPI00146F6656|nr:S8 family serine peptidase [Algicola sagamiensis]